MRPLYVRPWRGYCLLVLLELLETDCCCDQLISVSVLQLNRKRQTSNEQIGLQPAVHGRAEAEAEGVSPLSAGFTRPDDQTTQGIRSCLQRSV